MKFSLRLGSARLTSSIEPYFRTYPTQRRSVIDFDDVLHHVEHENDGHRIRGVAALLDLGGRIAQRPPAEAVRGVVYRLATLLVRFLDVVLLGPVAVFVNLFRVFLLGAVTAGGLLLALHQLELEDPFHAHRRPRTVHRVVIGVVKLGAQLGLGVVGVPIWWRYRAPEALDPQGGVDFYNQQQQHRGQCNTLPIHLVANLLRNGCTVRPFVFC